MAIQNMCRAYLEISDENSSQLSTSDTATELKSDLMCPQSEDPSLSDDGGSFHHSIPVCNSPALPHQPKKPKDREALKENTILRNSIDSVLPVQRPMYHRSSSNPRRTSLDTNFKPADFRQQTDEPDVRLDHELWLSKNTFEGTLFKGSTAERIVPSIRKPFDRSKLGHDDPGHVQLHLHALNLQVDDQELTASPPTRPSEESSRKSIKTAMLEQQMK